MDEHKVERTDEGDAIVFKTDAYRLAITNGNFAFLTDIHTGPGAGCTCHIRETWDIQNLRALLDEAEKVLQERELADAAKDFDEGFDDIPSFGSTDEQTRWEEITAINCNPQLDEIERCEKCHYPSSNETQCINCGTCLVCAWDGSPGEEEMCPRCDRSREYWDK